MVAGAEQGAVPLLRQSLPMQVVGGSGSLLGGRHARAVLVDDDAAEGLHAVRNPECVSDGNSQFALDGRRRIINLDILPGAVKSPNVATYTRNDQRQYYVDGSHEQSPFWPCGTSAYHNGCVLEPPRLVFFYLISIDAFRRHGRRRRRRRTAPRGVRTRPHLESQRSSVHYILVFEPRLVQWLAV